MFFRPVSVAVLVVLIFATGVSAANAQSTPLLKGSVQRNAVPDPAAPLPADEFAAGGGANCDWNSGACDMLKGYVAAGASPPCIKQLQQAVEVERQRNALALASQQASGHDPALIGRLAQLDQQRDAMLRRLPPNCFQRNAGPQSPQNTANRDPLTNQQTTAAPVGPIVYPTPSGPSPVATLPTQGGNQAAYNPGGSSAGSAAACGSSPVECKALLDAADKLYQIVTDTQKNTLAATDQFFAGAVAAVQDNLRFLAQSPGVPAQQIGQAIRDYLTKDNGKNHQQLLQAAQQAVKDFQTNPARFLGYQAGNIAVGEATGGATKLIGGAATRVAQNVTRRAEAVAQAENAAQKLIDMNQVANDFDPAPSGLATSGPSNVGPPPLTGTQTPLGLDDVFGPPKVPLLPNGTAPGRMGDIGGWVNSINVCNGTENCLPNFLAVDQYLAGKAPAQVTAKTGHGVRFSQIGRLYGKSAFWPSGSPQAMMNQVERVATAGGYGGRGALGFQWTNGDSHIVSYFQNERGTFVVDPQMPVGQKILPINQYMQTVGGQTKNAFIMPVNYSL